MIHPKHLPKPLSQFQCCLPLKCTPQLPHSSVLYFMSASSTFRAMPPEVRHTLGCCVTVDTLGGRVPPLATPYAQSMHLRIPPLRNCQCILDSKFFGIKVTARRPDPDAILQQATHCVLHVSPPL